MRFKTLITTMLLGMVMHAQSPSQNNANSRLFYATGGTANIAESNARWEAADKMAKEFGHNRFTRARIRQTVFAGSKINSAGKLFGLFKASAEIKTGLLAEVHRVIQTETKHAKTILSRRPSIKLEFIGNDSGHVAEEREKATARFAEISGDYGFTSIHSPDSVFTAFTLVLRPDKDEQLYRCSIYAGPNRLWLETEFRISAHRLYHSSGAFYEMVFGFILNNYPMYEMTYFVIFGPKAATYRHFIFTFIREHSQFQIDGHKQIADGRLILRIADQQTRPFSLPGFWANLMTTDLGAAGLSVERYEGSTIVTEIKEAK
jgi:hypothetical protein